MTERNQVPPDRCMNFSGCHPCPLPKQLSPFAQDRCTLIVYPGVAVPTRALPDLVTRGPLSLMLPWRRSCIAVRELQEPNVNELIADELTSFS
jgi:hypothetical protein